MYDDDSLGWLLFFGLIWNVLSFLVPVAAVILIVWLVRWSQQAGPPYRAQAFDSSLANLEQRIRTLSRSQGNLSQGQRQQISSAFLRARIHCASWKITPIV
jgi:hypothetical protein